MSATMALPRTLLSISALTHFLLMVLGCSYQVFSPQHTLCQYRSSACPGKTLLRTGGLGCSEKQLILDTHNQLRQSVALGHVAGQPPAAGMREMVWDEELAVIAQRWADQCRVGHDSARTVSRFRVGQNVAVTWTHQAPSPAGPGPEFRRQVEAWFNEVMRFGLRRDDIEHFHFSERTGHYSQLVWSDTYLVGCGYSYFMDPQRGYTKLYVCNYGPGGNVIGAHLYEAGQPTCTRSSLSSSRRYTGLCEVPGSNPPGMFCSAQDALVYASQGGAYHHPSQVSSAPSVPVYRPPRPPASPAHAVSHAYRRPAHGSTPNTGGYRGFLQALSPSRPQHPYNTAAYYG